MIKTRRSKTKPAVLFVSLTLAAVIIFFELSARPVAAQAASLCAKQAAAALLSDAVLDELNEFKSVFPDLVRIERDDEGRISSITTDALMTGMFKERVVKRLTRELSSPVSVSQGIPLGTLTGISLLSGYGPVLPLTYMMIGAPEAELHSRFTSGGINQSVHRVSVSFAVKIKALTPLASDPEYVNGEVLISEIVVIGKVPDTYWNRG